tara:strand:- start:5404 stop:5697 length:294 start_codon:yes stop_codon:yes gene_type:complete
MPRTTGSKNNQDYKYKVEKLNEEGEVISCDYYVTQGDIQQKYGLKRSAVYFIINNPNMRKTNDFIKIKKLEQPMPVFNIEKENEDGNIIFRYNKIIY